MLLSTSGFFLGVGPKTQGPKNSNSRNFSRKLKHFFSKKLKKPENAGNLFALYHKYILFMYQISPKNAKI